MPVYRSPYRSAEPVGVPALLETAADLYAAPGAPDPLALPETAETVVVERSGQEFVLSIALPFADREATELIRKGDEIVLTVGSYRRVLALPSALRRCTVAGAALSDGRLRIRFEPDPELWAPL
jgi:arsenite-transporting ATPase